MITYTDTFKKSFKEIYDDTYDLYLEKGSNLIGKILKQDSELRFTPTEILECSDIEILKEKARKAQATLKLYNEYWSQPGV